MTHPIDSARNRGCRRLPGADMLQHRESRQVATVLGIERTARPWEKRHGV
jgi:hypothetical protein